MSFEQREGNGALFKNKTDNEKAPQYKGDILLGGVVYELAAWVKESAKGKFFSLSGKVKGEKPAAKPAPVEDDDIFGDKMPF